MRSAAPAPSICCGSIILGLIRHVGAADVVHGISEAAITKQTVMSHDNLD
jgi:hypothetical protein